MAKNKDDLPKQDPERHRTFHVYQHVTSLSRMRIALIGKRLVSANTSEQRLVLTLWSLYAVFLEVNARDWYERKLEYDDGASKLSDPYFMQHG